MSKKSKLVRGLKCGLLGAFVSLAAAAVLPGCAVDMAPTDEAEQSATGEELGEAQQAVAAGDFAGWAVHSASGLHVDKSFNSTGGTIKVFNVSPGAYQVDFAGLGNGAKNGNVQVTSVGKGEDRCKAAHWHSFGTTLRVYVQCHFDGTPANEQFLVSYARFAAGSNAVSQDGAYLRSTSPTGESPVAPEFLWGAGPTSSVQLQSTGVYHARFVGQTNQDTGLIVTAVGSDASYCKIGNWFASGSDTVVEVRCFDDVGAPFNSPFSLRLAREIRDSHGQSGGYVWGHDATTIDYTPLLARQQNHRDTGCGVASETNTVHKNFRGNYTVKYTALTARGAAFATAYGPSSDFCKTEWWQNSPDGSALDVIVRCFDVDGFLKNSQYTSVLFSQYSGIC